MEGKISNKIVTIVAIILILLGLFGYGNIKDSVLYVLVTQTYSKTKSFIYDQSTTHFLSYKATLESSTNRIVTNLFYLNINTGIEKLAGIKVFDDSSYEVTELENGDLTFIYNEDRDIEQYARNLIELNQILEEKQTQFLYIQAPYKISKYDTQLKEGVTDRSNEYADRLLNEIEGKIEYIDIREEMYNEGLNQYEYFFRTDHHWKPEGAFWSFSHISETLNKQYGFNIAEEHTNLENYNIEVYEEYFLGSQGKRVGNLIAGVDDISLITPKFDTNLKFIVESEQLEKQGTFYETLIDLEHLQKELEISNDHHVYSGGNYDLATTINYNVDNKEKVLLIRDSFSCSFSPFLALGCYQLDTIDLREFKEQSLMEYLEDNDYDTVIMMYNPSMIIEEGFTFNKVI